MLDRNKNDSIVYNCDAAGACKQLTGKERGAWLIRNSVRAPGLLTISVSVKKNDVYHMRFGLTENGWAPAPMPPKKPELPKDFKADPTARERYKEKKVEYEKDMGEFNQKLDDFTSKSNKLFNTEGFAAKHAPGFLKTLITSGSNELQVSLNPNDLVTPTAEQATKLNGYSSYNHDEKEFAVEQFADMAKPTVPGKGDNFN